MATTYDKASLVMIPSGVKEDKLYSIKPTDGSGDLAFSRSNDTATRVNSSGLIEKVRTNLLTYSEDFTQNWALIGGGSFTANTTTAPDGTLTADTWTQGGYVRRDFTFSAIPYTYTLYVKATSGTSTGRIYFLNAADSAVAQTSYTANATGWQRISVTIENAVASGIVRIGFGIDTGTTSLYVWGAQLETGDIATEYIATTSAAVSVGPVANLPRLDYSGGASCPKLLLESQRTNLALYSEQFDNAAWTKSNTTISANAATSPDGYTNADNLIPSNGASLSSISNYALQAITKAASAIQYTYSTFAKESGLNRINIIAQGSSIVNNASATFSLVDGSISTAAVSAGTFTGASASVTDYGNGWYRCALVFTTNTDTDLIIRNIPTDSTLTTGNGTNGIIIYGAQLEAGAYATSYIPTLSAASTRGADFASKTGISSLIGQTEGTLFFEGSSDTIGGSTNLINFNFSSNSVVINKQSTGVIRALINTASAIVLDSSPVSGTFKVAIGYKNGDSVLYVNGTLAASSTNSFTFATALTEVNLGTGVAYFAAVNQSKCNQALVFKTRLTNAELAALTTI